MIIFGDELIWFWNSFIHWISSWINIVIIVRLWSFVRQLVSTTTLLFNNKVDIMVSMKEIVATLANVFVTIFTEEVLYILVFLPDRVENRIHLLWVDVFDSRPIIYIL